VRRGVHFAASTGFAVVFAFALVFGSPAFGRERDHGGSFGAFLAP
jgi:hypothetical protein